MPGLVWPCQDFVLVSDVEVIDPLTVKFSLTQSWSAFPAAALDTPCGTHMMAPSWLKTLESNPLREESRFTGDTLIDQETVRHPGRRRSGRSGLDGRLPVSSSTFPATATA